jgi:DnaK suppressor protein
MRRVSLRNARKYYGLDCTSIRGSGKRVSLMQGRRSEEQKNSPMGEGNRGEKGFGPRYKNKLTKKEIRAIRARLLEMKKGIWNELKTKWRTDIEKNYTGQPSTVLDDADLASANTTEQLELSIIESKERQLLEIEDALLRIEEGTFGTCVDCGNPINKKRLELVPKTRRCMLCQTDLERTSKGISRV